MPDEAGGTGGSFWEASEGERSLQRCQSLLDTLGDGLFRLDADDHLVAVDDGFVELTEYSREDLLGEHVSVLLAGSDANRTRMRLRDPDASPRPGCVSRTGVRP